MTIKLNDRLARDFQSDRTASALGFEHFQGLLLGFMRRSA
jgi:hypothetical protein